MQAAAGIGCSRIFVLLLERPKSADRAAERAPATPIERDRTREAAISHHYKVCAAGHTGNGRIEFPF